MERKEVEALVKGVLSEVSGSDPEGLDQKLKDDLGLDSLSLVSVLVAIEDRAAIVFDDGDLDPARLSLVKDLVEITWKNV